MILSFDFRNAYGASAKKPYEGKVHVNVRLYSPRIMTFDADNRLKPAQDAVQMAGVVKDDRQAMRSAVEKIRTRGREYTVIEVWKIEEASP
jgi:Holliday junction resolvase RusA-like endonuclease